ncbi:hypothetical protein ABT362_30575 [Nonomuraea rubra]|uniref:Uncharacterized protein n=1 Tax=Nonomuraea rubra TaxID=46180 RepID=A0A7X0P6R8_9ACTN|nr:hypothetical protein [Nonomuraea rubra]MBB6556116.1 hypothetical protein [Nonomuraea rubra]
MAEARPAAAVALTGVAAHITAETARRVEEWADEKFGEEPPR